MRFGTDVGLFESNTQGRKQVWPNSGTEIDNPSAVSLSLAVRNQAQALAYSKVLLCEE
jgi:hypothetical protein